MQPHPRDGSCMLRRGMIQKPARGKDNHFPFFCSPSDGLQVSSDPCQLYRCLKTEERKGKRGQEREDRFLAHTGVIRSTSPPLSCPPPATFNLPPCPCPHCPQQHTCAINLLKQLISLQLEAFSIVFCCSITVLLAEGGLFPFMEKASLFRGMQLFFFLSGNLLNTVGSSLCMDSHSQNKVPVSV